MKRSRLSVLLAALCLVPGVLAAQMTWTCATESAQWPARAGLSSTVFHDTMWVMGGTCWNGSEYVHKNDVWYSTDGDSWICATDSAQWRPRSAHASLVFDDKMWVIGGVYTFYPDYLCLNDVWWSADGVDWTLACTTAPWLPRRLHTALVYDDTMWVMGGLTDGNVLCTDVWKSGDGGSWFCATDTTWPTRAGHTSAVFHDTMWVTGGFRTSVLQDVWCSTDGSSWTSVNSTAGWSGRLSHSSAVLDDKLWVIAGTDISNSYNDVWYSTDGDSWMCATDTAEWTGRSSAASAVYSNRIWIMGGSPDAVSFFGDVWYSTGLGIEEAPHAEVRAANCGATVVRGVLVLNELGTRAELTDRNSVMSRAVLLDISGRKVTDLRAGANDVSELAPGVYFAREAQAQAVRKVVVTR